jgi:hypothetical protein
MNLFPAKNSLKIKDDYSEKLAFAGRRSGISVGFGRTTKWCPPFPFKGQEYF